jgi:putative copper resistance protein D
MNSLLVAARAVHFGSAMLLFGIALFELVVAIPVARGDRFDHEAPKRSLRAIATWSLAASLVSALAWLVCQTAAMSGTPLAQAVNRDALLLVLEKTAFGRVWMVRLGIALALAALLRLESRRRGDSQGRSWALAASLLAAAYLAAVAWTGHAAAGKDAARDVQLPSDAIHLLAAGAWLGSLPGLALLLSSRPPLGVAARAARRFSTLGVTSVSALVATGLVSAWYLVGDVPALIGTPYGRLLLLKLLLFAAMMGLAAVNRVLLTPRVAEGSLAALFALRRNALIEIAAGTGVVFVVAVLGVTVPAAHESPVWPFDHTLEWPPGEETAIRAAVAALGVAAVIALLVIIAGIRRRSKSLSMGGLAAILVPVAASAWLLAAPANPMSYATSPVRYTTGTIARGGALFAQHCTECHGASGQGDGPAAASLPTKPANLPEHAPHHRAGDLYWWIAHGIPDTPMPGFSAQLSIQEIWSVVAYLRALSDSRAARAITTSVEPWRPIVAPDFTFELGATGQDSLGQQAGYVTLLVFYTLPQSLPRLSELEAQSRSYRAAGVRVIALPMHAAEGFAGLETAHGDGSITAVAAPQVAATYAMFARLAADNNDVATPTHLEFLVDRQGYLRARWRGTPDQAARWTSGVLAQADLLNREPPRPPTTERHAH